MIHARYSLEDIDKAFALYENDKKPEGKVLIYSDNELLNGQKKK